MKNHNKVEEVLQAAIKKGADVEAKDATSYDRTPLQWAAHEGFDTIVKLLLDNGISLQTVVFLDA